MKIRIDPLDRLFGVFIKLRDKYCQRCGGTSGLQTAHFYGRGQKSTRWDEQNACLLCFGCHVHLDSQPLEKVEFFKQRLGEREFDLLQARARTPARFIDKAGITLYLKEKIKELGGVF